MNVLLFSDGPACITAVHVYGIFIVWLNWIPIPAEAAFQFRIDCFQFLCGNISGVWVKFCQYLRHCFFYQIGHVDAVHILVVYHPQ